ncbi:hypothetical protein Mgra_00002893 [Meloidogyne graminicola]|uniref:EF-hand domain-containing protein n=1 Tax=Meloidogyne graminicola TaxID=189291 RepID=A0A8S9ZVL2_9BILA|nr:hypothetical protein Mgra_00002893 [Meloidogyne graminicola]
MNLFLIIFIFPLFIYGQDELFEKYDEDQNERLNPKEFNKLLNEKMKAISGKGKNNQNNEFIEDSLPNLEIFKGIDTNNDGEIDEDEFEAQRELFDFISRMPLMDELAGDDKNEELNEKEIVDRLVEENEKKGKENVNESNKCLNDGECSNNTMDEEKNFKENKIEDLFNFDIILHDILKITVL